ncbi:hypothetical protein JKB30_002930 [Salmonella enterica]|uniref:hypothetical protein n=1 Tax=Salmonella enterica TaxID=28901 RepID=UPI0009ACE79C|nr:hypothetical protein [Salmonella enterica]EDV3755320.1 hypothetical protein [Salmonella enterica subsp. enterica]EAS1718277.1 hypothetical protein [Salmonella enterica]EAW9177638.1 hypothetical protein [Salmonella enterica]EAX8697433.1 hypothetical protein [Salmonella enterica]EAX9528112.1 hypothetical protein [Salmonella enterica]
MSEQAYDLTKIKEIEQTDDVQKANRLLANGWVLLKVSESQYNDGEGAIRSAVWFTLGEE